MIEYQIISDLGKRENRGEIIVTLFEWCDLKCKFCNQDHNSNVGMDTIRDKTYAIDDAIHKLKSIGKNYFSIHLMGGEVFSDFVDNSCFDDYKYLYDKYNSDNTEICMTTNFIFDNVDRVKQLLKDCPDMKLMTSYDPSGRFSEKNEQIFLENIEMFNRLHKVKSINVIMTKPNIRKFLDGDRDTFDKLYYKNYDFFFDYYTPEKNAEIMSPTDIQLRDLMKLMIERYPSVEPFRSISKKENQKMTCQDTYTIMPTGEGGFCTILLDDRNNFIPKEKLEKSWVEEYGCLECKYFQRCGLGCFLGNHLYSYKTQEVCWLSEVYDYVEGRSTEIN